MRVKISARKSDLARLQAIQVGQALQHKNPGLEIIYSFRESLGDKNLTDPLWKIPEKGVFTEDFIQDLQSGAADMVVHSWKDLPTEKKTQTMIAATMPRADQRDLILMKKSSWGRASLRIFSSSPRREKNLSPLLPEILPWKVSSLKFESVRGNIQTRVRKLLENSSIDGLVLAKAALDRLLLAEASEFQETRDFLRKAIVETSGDLRWMVLPLSANPNAAAQGALAVEIRSDRRDLLELLKSIHCEKTFAAAEIERDLLRAYGGGCHLALGMAVVVEEDWTATFVRGQAPSGAVVESREVQSHFRDHLLLKKFQPDECWFLPKGAVTRYNRPAPVTLTSEYGYIVSRFQAWPQVLSTKSAKVQDLKIWTSGLGTWKKLAKQGLWVLGTYDGLGDQRAPATEALLTGLEWVTLTHQRHPVIALPAIVSPETVSQASVAGDGALSEADPLLIKTDESWGGRARKYLIAYETDVPDLQIGEQKFFYWRSSSQFLQALQERPQLRSLWHGSGPGSTLRTLKAHLPADRISVFLSEEDCIKRMENARGKKPS